MRVLATFDPEKDLPRRPGDERIAIELGFVTPMEQPFAVRWDPRDLREPIDLETIGEEEKGIWMTVHPDTALLDEPALWEPVAQVRAGIHELTQADWDNMSAHTFDARRTMLGAIRRAEQRRIARAGERNG